VTTVRVLVRQAWFRAAIGLALLGFSVLAVWLRGPDWGGVYHAFDLVAWRWIALGVLINLLSVSSRAIAWHLVINQALPEPHPRHRTVFSAFCVGLLANAVLPARAGEIARVAVLRRRLPHGHGTTATLAGTVFAHRLFDLFPVLLLIGYTLETAKIPRWALTSIELFVAIGLCLLLIALVTARRQQRSMLDEMSPVRRLLVMGQRGLAVMKQPAAAAGATLFQTIGWTLQLLAVYTVMRAFDFGTLPSAALVLLLMNVATVFPFWPGNVGLLQAAIALPLLQYGVAYQTGFAFGLALQAVEMSVGVSLGLIFLAREGLSFGSLKSIRDDDDENGREPEAIPRARAAGDPETVEEDEPARAGLPG
jgi:glycosyltransferase 2 family protein